MDNPKARLRRTKKYGWGVYAHKTIRKGEVIAKFDGTFYDNDFAKWTDDLRNHAIQCDKTMWRDSKGLARYINHSCEPNCGIKRRYEIVAMRTIRPGEQVTWDYEMTENSPWWKMRCRCGSKICRKKIGAYKNMPENIRQKYKGFISSWLTKKQLIRS